MTSAARGLARIFVGGVHCINLDRDTERWSTTRDHLQSFGIEPQRFAATDGSTITIEQAQRDKVLGPKGVSVELLESRGAVGLAYTTVRLWKMIASCNPTPLNAAPGTPPLTKDEQRWFLIVEDDVVLDDVLRDEAFAEYLWSRVPNDADLVYLGFSGGYGGLQGQRRLAQIVSERTTSVNPHVLHVKGALTGAFAYAITPRTAGRLLDLITPFYRPIDYFPYNHLRLYAFKSFVSWPHTAATTSMLPRTDGRTWLSGLASVRPLKSTIRAKQAASADANALDEVRACMAERRYAEAADRLHALKPTADVMALSGECAHYLDGTTAHELLGYHVAAIKAGPDNAQQLALLARNMRNKYSSFPVCFAAALVARQLSLCSGASDTDHNTLFIADDELAVSAYYAHPSLRTFGRDACMRALANKACPASARSRLEYNLNLYGGRPKPIAPPPSPSPSDAARALLAQGVPNVTWCFWTGPQPMSPARAACYESMKTNTGAPLLLVTPDNLPEYILPDVPLHAAYEHLSYVHRSDYLRCYVMHHYGGAYHDIKGCGSSNVFSQALETLRADPNVYMVGYPEVEGGAASVRGDPALTQKLRDETHRLVGLSAFAARRHTPLTAEWMRRVHALLGAKLDVLRSTTLQDPIGYQRQSNNPLGYTQVLGEILHPLMLEHAAHIRRDLPVPNRSGYR